MTERNYSLTWDRTWQSREHDLSAFDGDLLVGRAYRALAGPDGGQWHWDVHATIGDHVFKAAGVANDQEAACQFVEEDYRQFRRVET